MIFTMKYLIDTDICGFYLRGKYSINEKIKEVKPEHCFVSEITILELIYGARKSEQYEKHIKDIQVIESLFTVLPIETVYDRFALEKVKLKIDGKLIPDFDLLIGSTAVERNLIMVTNNEKHLGRISGISIENWTNPAFNKFAERNT